MTGPALAGALPGAEIVLKGIEDIARGADTAEAAAVAMAATRLREVGIDVPEGGDDSEPAAHHLYALLAGQYGDEAHSRFNAISRRIDSFARAARFARAS